MIRDFQESLRQFSNDNPDVVSPVEHLIDQMQAVLEELAPKAFREQPMTPHGAVRMQFMRECCSLLDNAITAFSSQVFKGGDGYRLADRAPKVDIVQPAPKVKKLSVAKRDD